jgi:uncharacterized protein (DUF2384 family)
MSRKSYKTPPARLARVMEASRDLWKQRAAQKQCLIRSQRVTIRDLQASRDLWKARALQASQQLRQPHSCLPAPAPAETRLGES